MGGRGPGGELYPSLSLKRKVVLAAAKAAVFRINHNVDGCGDLAPPAHRSLRAQLLLANLIAHNLPFPCGILCGGQTRSHRPRLVVSVPYSTCPPMSPSASPRTVFLAHQTAAFLYGVPPAPICPE